MKKSTTKLNRTLLAAGATVLLVQLVSACGETDQSESSSTNWLPCDNDGDCSRISGAYCGADSICRDEDGDPVPVPVPATTPTGTGGGQATGGGSGTGGGSNDVGGAGGGDTVSSAGAGGSLAEDGGSSSGGAAGERGSAAGGAAGERGALGESGAGGAAEAGAGGAPACEDAAPLDTLDRACEVDSDCAVGVYQFDCCGSPGHVALNQSEIAALEAYNQACSREPMCDCLPQKRLEDGTVVDKTPAVQCVEQRCETTCEGPTSCYLSEDCSGEDECWLGETCQWIDPLTSLNLCRRASDGQCAPCPI